MSQLLFLTSYVHTPLPLDTLHSLDAALKQKRVLDSRTVFPAGGTASLQGWTHAGHGTLSLSNEKTMQGQPSLKLQFANDTGQRATGSPSDPDYATYGNSRITLDLQGENMEAYNRVSLYIYPDCEGANIVNMNLAFTNGDVPAKDGYNQPTGGHLINLRNGQWNHVVLEVGDLQRDRMKSIGLSVALRGKDLTMGDTSVYYINKVEFQRVPLTEKVSGWLPQEGKIIYSTTGYQTAGEKSALMAWQGGGEFQLVDAETEAIVYRGLVERRATSIGEYAVMDFSGVQTEGLYRLRVNGQQTEEFRIANDLWTDSAWRVLSFLLGQRCGYYVPGVHATCHTDLMAEHNGVSISYGGGWHDAGDLSQQTLQSADITYSLLEAYEHSRDRNPALAARLLGEARWGLEFMLRTRFGDGWRASSMGLLIWQDGKFGTRDDIHSVRTQNLAFDNFLYAAYEAYAARVLADAPSMKSYLTRVAREDFAFAWERFQANGFERFLYMYEHSYNTSESQYMATVSWAASQLYQLTGEKRYADIAADVIHYVIVCQQTSPIGKGGIQGFFYRNPTRKSIVHYIHHSREQIYMQAFTALCQTQPSHAEYPLWEKAITLYADYLKSLLPYTEPYRMLPSGIYHQDEYKDSTAFYALHLFPPSDAEERYTEQLKGGVRIADEYFIKRFPVWFNIYNGNNCVLLSTAKAAALCARFLHDEELKDVARSQMYWVVGRNPFGQSMIYGEGRDYPQMDSFSSGELTGEMPVGIRTVGDTDEPYWPQINNACYKEVWTPLAGKWLSLFAEMND